MNRLSKMVPALSTGLGLILISLLILHGFGTEPQLARAAGSRFVAPGGIDAGNDCSDSLNPCASPQYAVDVAEADDIIKIAAGVYTGVNAYSGLAQVVYISKNLTLRGGYTAAFSEPPDPEANPTTLDAGRQGRVLYITGDISVTVEGLQITQGDATGLGGTPWAGDAGGGIYIIEAEAILNNNHLFHNTAAEGGGIFAYDSRAIINGNMIFSNTANYGGGMALYNSSEFSDGQVIWNGQAAVRGNHIISNTGNFGAGLFLFYSDAQLDENTINGNRANHFGGGVYSGPGYPVFLNNEVVANIADEGGGFFLDIGSEAFFTNNVVVDNEAGERGSGFYIRASTSHLLHTTLANNQGGDGSGFYLADNNAVVFITNTIIASHTVGITVTTGSTVTLANTLWYGNGDDWAGAGLIQTSNDYSGDPAFIDPDNGDYHLGPTSAAIDKGVDAGVITDIDGDIRPLGDAADLGADELFTESEGTIFLPLILKN